MFILYLYFFSFSFSLSKAFKLLKIYRDLQATAVILDVYFSLTVKIVIMVLFYI